MIKINLLAKDGKIATDYKDKYVTLNDVSLIIYELERIKQELLEKDFDVDFEVKGGETK